MLNENECPIFFIFDVTPVAKGRPRMARGHTYTPRKTEDAEDALKKQMVQYAANFNCFPVVRACEVSINFFIKKPKSRKKFDHVTTRPDLDNYLKLVLDAGNGILWLDDSLIIKLNAEKQYGTPRIVVTFNAIY